MGTVIEFPSRPLNVEGKWFPNINVGVNPSGYIFVHDEHNEQSLNLTKVDLESITWWNPYPDRTKSIGHHKIRREVERESATKIPLGLNFAEAMDGKPWPMKWRQEGIKYVACLGTIVTFSRGQPMYPRLEINRYEPKFTKLTWRLFGRKFSLTERVPFVPNAPN